MSAIDWMTRGQVYFKYDGRCYYCGGFLPVDGLWHVDHANPRKQGGGNNFNNLIPACPPCNLEKKARTVEEYRAYLTSVVIGPIPFHGDVHKSAYREIEV